MTARHSAALILQARIERWPLKRPFRITGHSWEALDVLFISLESRHHIGRGEAMGVFYKGDDAPAMLRAVEGVRRCVEAGIDRKALQGLLPACGARNALDCAMWDLESKQSASPAWRIADLAEPRPLRTTWTCSADEPRMMAAAARSYVEARAVKIKLTGEAMDDDRVRAVRDARPDVWLGVDANQGFTRPALDRLMPVLVELDVRLIEQPFPVGQDHLLDGFKSPIPIAADESVQQLTDIAPLVGRYDVVNIKLDKCGGLTEGLAMARTARELGLTPMVGNNLGTSLGMAPAFLLGQLCEIADLDGPLFLTRDRAHAVEYAGGEIRCCDALWGNPNPT